jgi:hypothetical protein
MPLKMMKEECREKLIKRLERIAFGKVGVDLCQKGKDGGTGDGEDGDTHLGTSTLELSWWGDWNDWDGSVAWGGWGSGSSGDWGDWRWGSWLLWSLGDNWGFWNLCDWGNRGNWSLSGWSWGNNWDVGGGVSWASSLLWWAGSDGHDLGLVDDNVWVGNGIDTEDNGGDSGDGRETHFDVCSCFFV